MSSWHSYPSVYNVGHGAVANIFSVPHVLEEKIDGSQFSFGVIDGKLRVRSKGVEWDVMEPTKQYKMFDAAVASVLERAHLLHPEWTYRGEYLAKPKHNTLVYERTPKGYIILFDVNSAEETYLSPEAKREEADRIGLECVPELGRSNGGPAPIEEIRALLTTVSVLGAADIEGFVIKPLVPIFGRDKKLLIAKHVSEAFKEVHRENWRATNSHDHDVLTMLSNKYTSTFRWEKAIQHLRDAGKLENSPRDIGLLVNEIPADIQKEEETAIKASLFGWAWPQIRRNVVKGFAEYYKQKLLADAVLSATGNSADSGKSEEAIAA